LCFESKDLSDGMRDGEKTGGCGPDERIELDVGRVGEAPSPPPALSLGGGETREGDEAPAGEADSGSICDGRSGEGTRGSIEAGGGGDVSKPDAEEGNSGGTIGRGGGPLGRAVLSDGRAGGTGGTGGTGGVGGVGCVLMLPQDKFSCEYQLASICCEVQVLAAIREILA